MKAVKLLTITLLALFGLNVAAAQPVHHHRKHAHAHHVRAMHHHRKAGRHHRKARHARHKK